MTKLDDIFNQLEYTEEYVCNELGLVLYIYSSDGMKILYENIDVVAIENFIENARNKKDAKLELPIEQFGESFFNNFTITNGVFSVGAYEGKSHCIDSLESEVETQLPFLEIICEAIIECINTEYMCEKMFFYKNVYGVAKGNFRPPSPPRPIPAPRRKRPSAPANTQRTTHNNTMDKCTTHSLAI